MSDINKNMADYSARSNDALVQSMESVLTTLDKANDTLGNMFRGTSKSNTRSIYCVKFLSTTLYFEDSKAYMDYCEREREVFGSGLYHSDNMPIASMDVCSFSEFGRTVDSLNEVVWADGVFDITLEPNDEDEVKTVSVPFTRVEVNI